jgi:hypothetical protein
MTTFMKTCALLFAAALIGLAFSGWSKPSDEAVSADVTATPAFKAFLTNYVAAINSKDRAKLNECIHPTWVALMAKDQKYTDNWFNGRFAYSIPAEVKVSATAMTADKPPPFANDGIVFPVRPTYQVQIDFKPNPTNIVAMVLWVVNENDKWYEVFPSAPKKN